MTKAPIKSRLPEITPADLKRAREIERMHWPFQGRMGTQPENIARAIAQGIAEGREQGRAEALKAKPDA
jgi:hypothetical protein